jgi:peptidyl-prolyl cis-trans isomerase A (cyclophilin A)
MFFTTINLAKFKRTFKLSTALLGLSATLIIAQPALATIVQFQTVLGDFSVNLYDKTTPKTVENFLTYVNSSSTPYKNSVIHRSVPGFIVQGGGFKYDTKLPLLSIPQNAAVINEPIYANKRGTIAMAKLGTNPNSATNQWFFNLKDNSSNLDSQNEGFTVFGEVTGNGMAIVDAMAALSVFDLSTITNNGALTDVPLRNYTATDATKGVAVTDKNLVMILGIVVLDANVDTAANLTPAKTTHTPSTGGGSGGGGGGSTSWLSLLLLIGIVIIGRSRREVELAILGADVYLQLLNFN